MFNLCQLLLSSNWAYSSTLCSFNTWVCDNLVHVMSDCCLGDWAHIVGVGLEHIWVIGRKDCGGCAHNRAESVVHLLSLGLIHGVLESWAFLCGCGAGGDWRMCGEVVMMVGGSAYDGALSEIVSTSVDSKTCSLIVRLESANLQFDHPSTSLPGDDLVGGHHLWFQ